MIQEILKLIDKLWQLGCKHREVVFVKFRGPIRLRIEHQYYRCLDCYKEWPTAFSTKIVSEEKKRLDKFRDSEYTYQVDLDNWKA